MKYILTTLLLLPFISFSDNSVLHAENLNSTLHDVNKVLSPACAGCSKNSKKQSQELSTFLRKLQRRCRNQRNVSLYGSLGFYRLGRPEVTVMNGGEASIHTDVYHFECVEVNGKYKMQSLADPYNYSYFSYPLFGDKDEKKQVLVQKGNYKLSITRDSIETKELSSELKRKEFGTTSDIKFNIKSLLTKEEKFLLKSGKEIVVPLNFAKTSSVSYYTGSKELIMRRKRVNDREFTVKFSLKSIGGKFVMKPI